MDAPLYILSREGRDDLVPDMTQGRALHLAQQIANRTGFPVRVCYDRERPNFFSEGTHMECVQIHGSPVNPVVR